MNVSQFYPTHRRNQRESQFQQFINTLFKPTDTVEIRAIEHDTVDGKSGSQVVSRFWDQASGLASQFGRLDRLNQRGADIYFGVNPRTQRSGTKKNIKQCRFLWADLDNVDPRQIHQQIGQAPEPTVVIASGHGAHLYWQLDTPVDVSNTTKQRDFESMLGGFCRGIGGDATHDVTRILRLPGFMNLKREPVPCYVISINDSVSYLFDEFDQRDVEQGISLNTETISTKMVTNMRFGSLTCDVDVGGRIDALIRRLDYPVDDRSRRDFGVVCELLRLGLSPERIRTLVMGRSKFTTDGYIDITIGNALRQIYGQ